MAARLATPPERAHRSWSLTPRTTTIERPLDIVIERTPAQVTAAEQRSRQAATAVFQTGG